MNEFKFEPRKVVKIGYTLFVSIPVQWARNKNVEKGSQLLPILGEEGLLLKPVKEADE